jgi:hypothetical protein
LADFATIARAVLVQPLEDRLSEGRYHPSVGPD